MHSALHLLPSDRCTPRRTAGSVVAESTRAYHRSWRVEDLVKHQRRAPLVGLLHWSSIAPAFLRPQPAQHRLLQTGHKLLLHHVLSESVMSETEGDIWIQVRTASLSGLPDLSLFSGWGVCGQCHDIFFQSCLLLAYIYMTPCTGGRAPSARKLHVSLRTGRGRHDRYR